MIIIINYAEQHVNLLDSVCKGLDSQCFVLIKGYTLYTFISICLAFIPLNVSIDRRKPNDRAEFSLRQKEKKKV